MVLTPHGIFGAVVAIEISRRTTQTALGITLAFFSHFLLDAIPHWDYLTSSLKKIRSFPLAELLKNRNFWQDALSIALDLLTCFLIIIFLFGRSPQDFLIALGGAFAAILPDLLQFLHWVFPSFSPLSKFKKFHHQFHALKKPKSRALGIFWQVTFTAATIVASLLF